MNLVDVTVVEVIVEVDDVVVTVVEVMVVSEVI